MAANQNGKILSHSGLSRDLIQDPQFFTVVTFPTDLGLKIPYAFMRKYGGELKNAVLLKVPCGGAPSWKVELVHHHENGTILKKGWKEFAEYYSIEKFFLLVFRYKGNSQFLVLIFDPSAMEIEYSDDIVEQFSSAHVFGKNHGKRNRKTLVEDTQEDDLSVEILDDFTQFKPMRKNHMRTRSPSVSSTPITFDFSAPFFIAIMKPSYLMHSMEIPKKFAKQCLSRDEERHYFMFCVKGKIGSWTVPVSSHHAQTAKGRKRFDGVGWRKFVKDNGLSVGDVCIFELLDPRRKFNITVYKSRSI